MFPIQTSLFFGCGPFGLGGLGLTPFSGALLLFGVMRMDLFVVLAARTTEKEQNWLSVGTAHTPSVRSWRPVVKRSTVSAEN
jgi:hypothetical protein